MKLTLRPYQLQAVEQIRDSFRRGKRAPLFVLPTGGGKTACFSYIAMNAVSRGNRVMILVHRQELLSQASSSLSRLGVSHGLISPRFAQSRDAVQVASVQTLVRRLDRVTPPELIIVDESHHATASTYRKIFEAFERARVLGVTATPCRTSGDGLSEIFDDLILGPSIRELIEGGFLVHPTVYAPPVGLDLSGVHKRMGDYDKRELGDRLDRPTITGSAVEHYIRIARGQPAIAFCVSINHAEHVADEFRARGFRAIRVDGNMDDSARRAAIEGLGNGKVDVLTSADLIGEGVDIPNVSVAILLRPTHSLALYLQQVGRALRPAEGKTSAIILDHVGNVMRHGFPDDDREWTLEGAEKQPGGSREEISVRVSQCEKCFFVYESGPERCPSCGHAAPPRVRKVSEREGELEKLDREAVERARKAARMQQGGAKTLEDLVKIGQARGYSNPRFWAEKVFKGRKRA